MKNQNTNYQTLWGKDITDTQEDSLSQEHYQRWHEQPEKEITGGFPLNLDIEATSICNLKCPTCIQTMQRQVNGIMSLDLYEKIIDEASANGCFGIKYHTIGRGEPLLNKELPKMVMYAKKKGIIDVCLNTNAVLLTGELSQRLLDSGLDRISFSIDSHKEDDYAKIRVGADFNFVITNMRRFKIKRNQGGYETKIRIQAIDLPGLNKKEYVDFFKFYCDEIGLISYKQMDTQEDFISKWKCPQLWQRMSILFDGIILPCNHDQNLHSVLGNINNGSIRKLWNGTELKYMRSLHSRGKAHFLASCNHCPLRATEARKGE